VLTTAKEDAIEASAVPLPRGCPPKVDGGGGGGGLVRGWSTVGRRPEERGADAAWWRPLLGRGESASSQADLSRRGPPVCRQSHSQRRPKGPIRSLESAADSPHEYNRLKARTRRHPGLELCCDRRLSIWV